MSTCPLGGIKVTVSGADVCCQHGVVLNVELLFGAHVSWIVFSAFYFQGSQSCCLSLTAVCPHIDELQRLPLKGRRTQREGSGYLVWHTLPMAREQGNLKTKSR